MDHRAITETLLAERYVLGQLPPGEAADFEEHFLDCDECLERLELARGMRQSLLAAAAEDAARATATRQLGLLAWLAHLTPRSRSRQAALLLSAVALLVLAPSGLLLNRVGDLDRELARTRATLRAERQARPPAPRTAGGAETTGDLAKAQGELSRMQERFAREMGDERARRERLAQALAQAERPETNTPILALGQERSGGEEGDPARRLTLPRGARRVVLTLDLREPDFATYRATLKAGKQRLWQGAGLVPGDTGALVVTVPAALLKPGDYEVEVEGVGAGGRPTPVARYRFRVRAG
jgi:hypothetical protein